jgi:predicted kinase
MPLEVVVLMGLQGAGKSTFYRERFASTHALVSKDLLRSGDRQVRAIDEALRTGRPVVVDNTNPARADRAALVSQARRWGARVVGYFFLPDLPGCRRRNAGRAGRARVPDVALHVTARKLEPPAHDEGFDELYDVRLDEATGFALTLRARAATF